ncbi:hypothetical protein ACSYGO_06450 [Streptomyces krungchingensis]
MAMNEAWYIPAKGSDRLLVVNHPMACNRYGFPGQLEPWHTELGVFGGFEVDFLTELRFLHDPDYNILTYDLRNHGLSSDTNGVTSGLGPIEARDVVGSLRHVRSQDSPAAMKLGLYTQYMGANSTIGAMNFWPEEFGGVLARRTKSCSGSRAPTSASTPTTTSDSTPKNSSAGSTASPHRHRRTGRCRSSMSGLVGTRRTRQRTQHPFADKARPAASAHVTSATAGPILPRAGLRSRHCRSPATT